MFIFCGPYSLTSYKEWEVNYFKSEQSRKKVIQRYIHKRTHSNTKTREELTHRSRDGAPSLRTIRTVGSNLFVRGPGLDVPGGALLLLQSLLLTMVIFHMIMQKLSLTEWLCAAGSTALKRVVVEVDGQDRWRLVFDNSVHWGKKYIYHHHKLGGRRNYINEYKSFVYLFFKYIPSCTHMVLCWICWGCGNPASLPL